VLCSAEKGVWLRNRASDQMLYNPHFHDRVPSRLSRRFSNYFYRKQYPGGGLQQVMDHKNADTYNYYINQRIATVMATMAVLSITVSLATTVFSPITPSVGAKERVDVTTTGSPVSPYDRTSPINR
jgi:hypothetical protein